MENKSSFFRGNANQWQHVNKGTTQGSVSGPHPFNLVTNDPDIVENEPSHIVKYADDTTVQVKVCKSKDTNTNDQICKEVEQYFDWSRVNCMPCNINKYNEVVIHKKTKVDMNSVISIKQVEKLKILGVTFQGKNRFNEHVKGKLTEANQMSIYSMSLDCHARKLTSNLIMTFYL